LVTKHGVIFFKAMATNRPTVYPSKKNHKKNPRNL